MLNIDKFVPTDIFQDTTVNYPVENLSNLLHNHQNTQMGVEDRDWLFKSLAKVIMSQSKEFTRVVEVRENKLIVTDKFVIQQAKPEEIIITIETKDDKSLSCTISIVSKKTYKYNVTVSNLTDIVAMSQLVEYVCDLASNHPWSGDAHALLQEIAIADLTMSRDFVNEMSKEHGVLYPDNFQLFNQTTKRITQLIKTKDGYIVERILDTK